MNNTIENAKPQQSSYSLRTLLFATALIAWILGVNNWLGDPYGWMTAIPLALGLPVFILRPWSFVGGIAGFVVFALFGEFFIIGWDKTDPEYLPCLVTIGGYGLACGAGALAFFLRLRVLGGITCLSAAVAFVILLQTA